MKNLILSLSLLCLISCFKTFAQDFTGEASFRANVEMNTKSFSLEFSADGKPLSFKTKSDEKELLDRSLPGDGFVVTNKAKAKIRLSNLKKNSDKLIATSSNGTQQIVFTVKENDNYLHFEIESLKGFPTNSGFILSFNMKVDPSVKAFATDYMTDESNQSDGVSVEWNYLWNRNKSNPLGSFALYHASDEDQEDDILLRIWANENLPHPNVQGEWTYQRAKEWVSQWQSMFKDQSQFILEADNLKDLYKGVKYAEKAGVKQIYLFTNTWRGGFWPTTQAYWQLREDVFPDGVKDVRKYSDHLLSKGIYLKFHFLSGSLGFSDPVYVGENPDRRLASWGSGKLAQPAKKDDTVLYFKPDQGVELPSNLNWWDSFYLQPPLLDNVHGFHRMRIENEIILVGDFQETDKDIWKLTGCQRGMYTTEAADHTDNAGVAGLIDTYGVNFVPDNDSPMLEEMAKAYADLCNQGGVYNVEFDGLENNGYHGRWGGEKFASLIYKHLDHPTTTGSSGGRAPDCWIEYKLNSTKRLMEGFRFHVHSSYRAPLLLALPGREATKLLDAHYELSQGAAAGAPGMGMSKPQPMFGLTVDELETYGLTNKMAETVRNWKIASEYMTDEQRKTIKESFLPADQKLPDSSRDPRSPYVHWIKKIDDHTFAISPVKVMTRKEGDIMWHSWQEHGPIEPKQYIKPGDQLELDNPFSDQPVEFIIRVLWAVDHDSNENIDLLSENVEFTNLGDTEINPNQNGLEIKYDNPRGYDRWSPDDLPQWTADTIDMTHHRAVGMYVTGDGSNSVLTFEIPGNDYVVPINFKGTRYVEIPNGQAAWANGYWGWRVGTHRGSYNRVGRFNIGFGYVPRQTSAEVEVKGLKALKEIDTELVNPVINIGTGTLNVYGSIKSNQYLQYDGGNKALVYDENWNKVKDLPVKKEKYTMPKGWGKISVSSDSGKPLPWLEVQFMTKGSPMVVNIKK